MVSRYVTDLQGDVRISVVNTLRGPGNPALDRRLILYPLRLWPWESPDPTKKAGEVDGKGVHLNTEFRGK